MRHPYTLTDTDELPTAYLAGVLEIFDAGLAIVAAPPTTPQRMSCCPARGGARVCRRALPRPPAYGPHTQSALTLLRQARTLAPTTVTTIRHTRAALNPEAWTTARHTVENAAGGSPTDPYLANALWGAAATQAFTGRFPPHTSQLLATSWRSAGPTLPG